MRKLALRTLLGSIALSTVFGIAFILTGKFDNTALRILATSLSVSAASLIAMGAFAGWELPQARVVARIGVASSVGALALTLAGIWVTNKSELGAQLAGSLAVVAAACAHTSLTSLARLAPSQAWLRGVAHAVMLLLVASVLAVIWDVSRGLDMARMVSVLTILEAAATLAVIAFHFVARVAPPVGAAVAEVCFCPSCGKRLWQPAGEVRCHHCDLSFTIELHRSSPLPSAVARTT